MDITNFAEAREILNGYIPVDRQRRGAYTLENMKALMHALGDPQQNYKVIHVAGTSGKTSTCYYLSSLLKESGKKIGLTVSPHVDEINERVQINLQPLSEKKYCAELTLFLKEVAKTSIRPIYFELLTAFALWEFARQKVDYAVVEVGIGGLLDSTNIFKLADKTCVITDIGFDHTDMLGKTIDAITAQKAGIIQPGNHVFMYDQGEEVMSIVREVAEQQHADLHEVWELKAGELPKNLSLFQRRNWYLALITYDYVSKRDNLPELDEEQLARSSEVVVPARMEPVQVGDKTVILDGSHNSQKLASLAASVRNQYGSKPMAVLLSIGETKLYKLETGLKPLLQLATHVVITSFGGAIDAHIKSVDPLRLADYCFKLGFQEVSVIHDPEQAYEALLKCPEDVLLVTGSFYLLNHVRPLVKAAENS